MNTSPIDATLSPEDQAAVLAALATIEEKLPFLIDISIEQRISLPKMGDKSRAFVSKAVEVAAQNPDFLPRSFDVDEMRRHVALFEALQPIALRLTRLQELVDDTQLATGSEAYTDALTVYNYARNSGKGQALDTVVDEMGRRFARKARAATPRT